MTAPLLPHGGAVQAVLFCLLLLAASLWDIHMRTIPDALSLLILLTGLFECVPDKLPGALIGLPMLGGALLADYVKIGGIGGGDVKLTTACGVVLGFYAGTTGLCLGLGAFYLAYRVLILHCQIKRQIPPDFTLTAIPMAPFLSVGFIAVYFLDLGGFIT